MRSNARLLSVGRVEEAARAGVNGVSEAKGLATSGIKFETLLFGGGTPTNVLPAKLLQQLCLAVFAR